MSLAYRGAWRDASARISIAAMLMAMCGLVDRASGGEVVDWPGFRGVRGDGVSAERDIFSSAGVRLDVAWKRPLGGGYSGICVAEGRIVTIFCDGRSEVVIALAAADGSELWRYELDQTYKGHDGSQDGPISTPFTADGRVFALSPRGKLAALDAATGEEIWTTHLVDDHGGVKPHWGFGTSPLVASGVLVIQVGAKDAMVCGFETQTGRRLWAAGDDAVYYQSPVAFSHNGRPSVLVAGNTKVLCVDPKSGHVFWQYAHNGSGEYGSICMVPVPLDQRRIFLDHKDHTSMLLEIAGAGEGTGFETLWEERSFAKSYMVAVHHAGYIYGYRGRTSTCVDAKSGKTMWRSRQPGDGFPIMVDDHLIILTKDGSLHVAKTSQESYQEVARLEIFADLTWTPPSFARGSIFARSFGEVARVDTGRGARPTPLRHDAAPDIAGTRFAQFLKELRDTDDKSTAIDRFLRVTDSFPMIEPDGRVVFVYRGPGDDLAIGGDVTGFGNKLPMKRVDRTNLFYSVARFERDARISYAFVRDFKAVADPLNPRRTIATGYDEEMELNYGDDEIEVSWVAMPEWEPPTHFDEPDDSRRGRIESHNFKSAALDTEVSIDVYTPAGYEQSTDRFPVAYLHGGRLARGPLRLPTALDNLTGRRIAPLIAVFINHDPPFFSAENYARMCALELPALVDQRYRTVRSRMGRAHVAWGPGGYAALYTVLAHPDATGKVGVQSPLLVDLAPLQPVMKKASEAPLAIYLDWGKYDTRSRLEFWSTADMGHKLQQYLRDHGYRPVGGEAHDGGGVASWQNRIDDLFVALFPLQHDR